MTQSACCVSALFTDHPKLTSIREESFSLLTVLLMRRLIALSFIESTLQTNTSSKVIEALKTGQSAGLQVEMEDVHMLTSADCDHATWPSSVSSFAASVPAPAFCIAGLSWVGQTIVCGVKHSIIIQL